MTGYAKNVNLSFAALAALFIAAISMAAFSGYSWISYLPFCLLLFGLGWQKKELVFWLLVFSLPFSFEYKVNDALGTDLPDELLMLFTSFLFFAYLIYKPASISKITWSHPLIILVVISFTWTLVSSLFAGNSSVSLKFLLAKTWYAGAFILAPLILFSNKKTILTTAVLLCSAMFIVVLITLFRHSAYNFRFANINDALHPFFRNHVNYSAMLVCLLPIGIGLYANAKSKKLKYFILFTIVVSLFALGFSYSRGAWLALITGGLAWWLTKKGWLFKSYLILMGLSMVAIIWLSDENRYLRYAPDYKTTIFHKDFGEHLVSTYKLKDVSTAERFYRWIAGVRMIKDNWLTGYGPNNFYDNYKEYAVPAYKTWVSDNKEHSTIHNYFLLVAVEQGIPGLIILLVLFGAMLYYAQSLYYKIKDPFYRNTALVVAVMITMIITVNFLSDLIETDKIGSLFFLSIALLVSLKLPPNIQRISQTVSE